jgi:hypothetical protein
MNTFPAVFALLIAAPLAGPIATPVMAQDLSADEAVLSRIIDNACLELVEDLIGCENVILLAATEDTADLLILPDYRNTETSAPLLVARGFVWAGPMFGQWPSVSQRDNGSLVITAEQFGIGRGAWPQNLTLAWRDGAFVVAGLTRAEIDRAYAFSAVCDVNLLTGGWSVTVETCRVLSDSGVIEGRSTLASNWAADRPLPAPCIAAGELLYAETALCEAASAPEGCDAPVE